MGKRRIVGFGREVDESRPAESRWSIGKQTFRFTHVGGINLWLLGEDGAASPLMHAKNVGEAAMFAEGFAIGCERVDLDAK